MPRVLLFTVYPMAIALLAPIACGSLSSVGPPKGTKRHPTINPLAAGSEDWRSGDVIFRRGTGIASQAVLAADPDSSFSHVGLLLRSSGELLVVHALPADESAVGSVRAEPIRSFLSGENATAIAIYRFMGEPWRAQRAAAVAFRWAKIHLPFDDRFDLRTTDRVHCTELVRNAFRASGVDLVDGRFDHLDLPLRRGDFLLPSRLAASRRLSLIRRNSSGETQRP